MNHLGQAASSVQRRVLERATSSARLISLGFLLWTLDIRIAVHLGGSSWSWDLLNDALGMVLCTLGLLALASLNSEPRFRGTMAALSLVCAFAALLALLESLRPRTVEDLAPAVPILRWIGAGAIAAFCVTVSRFCRAEAAETAAQSWILTLVLFYLATTGAPIVLEIATPSTARPDMPLGHPLATTLLVGALQCVPVVHSFVSTSRMRRKSTCESHEGSQESNEQRQRSEQPRNTDQRN